jgi:hypothetical protein
MVDAEQVLLFLGRPNDTALEQSAEQAIPVVSTMVRAYVRGTGEGWTPNDELEAVVVTATARQLHRLDVGRAGRVEPVPQTRLVGPATTRRSRQDVGMPAAGKFGAPTRCPRGHPLRSDRTLVRTVACSCGMHTSWRCHCGKVTYGPALAEACSLRSRRAHVR